MFVPGTAGARQTFETSILPASVETVDTSRLITGTLDSNKGKCLRDRKVKLVTGVSSVALLDTDRSSENGAWAVQAPIDEFGPTTRVKVAKKRIGNDTCGRDTADVKP
jgi:hypothetical protein